MFYTENKLEARIKELSEYRYRHKQEISTFNCMQDTGEIGAYPPDKASDRTIDIGDKWRGRDVYLWLQTDLEIPAEWKGKKAVGLFDFGRTGGGNNSGFESLLFLNQKPFQGVDSNHKEVFFPEEAAGKSIRLDFRLWSGLEGGGPQKEQEYTIRTAEIAWLDEQIDDLYFTSQAVYETIKELREEAPEKQLLLTSLNQSYKEIDWTEPGSSCFYKSCYQARAILNDRLGQIKKHHSVTIHAIGHTHIDVAWLWRLKHTREKTARSFSTVLRLMEQYPDYVFLQTQPQLYEYLKTDYPEIYEQLKMRINEGMWEAEGAMWLEADCNIPNGESLVRQILYGSKFLKEEFGITCRYLWLPDVFGYSWALPQILKKSGISTFMTTKISWNQYNRMPHDTFRWRGIDGSEILTHFVTTPEPWNSDDSWFYTYNGLITAKTVNGTWKSYRDKDINQDLLLSYGYGDGGGGVNREMLEFRRRYDKMPGLPHVKPSKAGDYFTRLHENIQAAEGYVHDWDGELYLEYHRGTYTSQAYNKKMNRKLELAYRETEWLQVLHALQSEWSNYPKKELDQGWKIILRNQFHDIIPGSSIKEVYEDSKLEYDEAWKKHKKFTDHAAAQLTSSNTGKHYTAWNSSHWQCEELAFIPFDDDNQKEGNWHDDLGSELTAQQTNEGWLVKLTKTPSFGGIVLEFRASSLKEKKIIKAPFQMNQNSLTTPFYEIAWNHAGQLTQIYDVSEKREVLAEGSRANVLQIFEDKPLAHDAWDIDLFYQEKMQEVTELISIELIECGSIRTIVQFNWSFNQTKIKQQMIVYCHSKRIDFKTHIDWQERRKLLKAAFPVDVRTTDATYDIQYGNVMRPNHWNTSWDMARFESVGHQWADLSETGYGVSLLNDCKYGYDIKGNVLRLSLLKGAMYPDPTADCGDHEFTYSILPHKGDWREGGTVREAWFLNSPLFVHKGQLSDCSQSFLSLSSQNLHIDAIKKAEENDMVIVRLHEFEGRRGEVTLSSDWKIEEWHEVNLLEEPLSETKRCSSVTFKIKPYEIKTFAIRFTCSL
ncbi:MAG: alpha-mannosidase [Bacillota bacterium]